jgi:hypothetical protein
MSGAGERRIDWSTLKQGLPVMTFAYLRAGSRKGRGREGGGRVRAQHSSREGNLLSALAMVIKATNGSAMSSKIERMFMGGGFVETGSRPA